MSINDSLKNKHVLIITGIIFLIVIIVISGGQEESAPEPIQPQVSQEQSIKTNEELEIKVQEEQQDQKKTQKELSKIRLENCLSEADTWFDQAKQTAIEILEEEKKTYNPHQEFIDQHSSSLDEIVVLLLEELEDYKAECYEKYPQM